ncbi:MAG: TetR family transcriptional regulator [Parvibaculum sp.]|uniref:TetR/AcrR family transcriptional regulator n=1 Tax=Parvibaculum sp. TaxID=2024848 RepID=UPI0025DEB67F|nr:TetR family transcriptional regulator [Parvibaculum sp.]MCE9648198.1 TetR family transcriptional regulator [Parvibaculum sp.]
MAGVREKKAQKTKTQLIAAARRLFAKQGFAATSTDEILQKAGVTRGALYHHFQDKAALFEAVCVALHEEAVAAIADVTGNQVAPFDALVAGSLAWIDHMAQPEVNRILIVEAPAVLGWERWNALDRAHGFGELMQGVAAAREAGAIRPVGVEELTVLLNGAMNAGVLWTGHAGGAQTLKRMKKAVRQLLFALRI